MLRLDMNSAFQYKRFDMPHMYIGPFLMIYGLLPRRQMASILDWPVNSPPQNFETKRKHTHMVLFGGR